MIWKQITFSKKVRKPNNTLAVGAIYLYKTKLLLSWSPQQLNGGELGVSLQTGVSRNLWCSFIFLPLIIISISFLFIHNFLKFYLYRFSKKD